MQLIGGSEPSSGSSSGASLRGRLRAAACLLLAAGTPSAAAAQTPGKASTHVDVTGLIYSESQRTTVIEPVGRITRLFADGQTLSAQFAIDAMTGASPTGANPSGVLQTTTSASGNTTTSAADQVPTAKFSDLRGALDLEWSRPLGVFTGTLGGHASREKDYESFGGNAKLSVDLDQRLTTVTVGGGTNSDRVFPKGGIMPGLTSGQESFTDAESKRVVTALAGVSRVLSRRWLAGVNVSRTRENGYLTEPYKILSLIDASGSPTGTVTEKRPDHRERTSVLVNSVYHLTDDILYVSYRYYWDDWDIRSHTIDLRYRKDMFQNTWLEPHVRFYAQSAADFFHQGLPVNRPLPAFASADQRLGELRTVTLGATYGFRIPGQPGEFSVRAEYMGQFGNGHPKDAVGLQREIDLAPPVSAGSLFFGWSIDR